MIQILIQKVLRTRFLSKINAFSLDGLWAGVFFKDDSVGGLQAFNEDETFDGPLINFIKGECGHKWGVGGYFDRCVNETEEDIWGDEDWGKNTCEEVSKQLI